jgi:hypothetical protein
MPPLVIILFFISVLVLYSRYRNGIWITREIYLNIFGERNQGKIIDVYIKDRNLRENYVYQKTYIMAVEYLVKEVIYTTKIIVTDSETQSSQYCIGNTLFIITNKRNKGISILDYGKYKIKGNIKNNKKFEKKIDDIVKDGKKF